MTSRVRSSLDVGIVCVVLVVSTVCLFKSVLFSPNHVALGQDGIDLPAQLWILWWDNHPQRDQLVNVPFGNIHFYVLTPIHNWLAKMLYPNVILGHNIVSWFGLALSAIAGGMMGRRFTNHRLGVCFGCLALISCAPLLAAFQDGTGEFIWVGCLGFCLLYVDKLREAPSLRNGVGLSIALTVTILCSWYYGAAGLILTLVIALYFKGSRLAALACISVSILASSPWIRDFMTSDFETRRVRTNFWAQLTDGSIGPVADLGVSGIPWMARTQLSVIDQWWSDLWIWAVVPLFILGWSAKKESYAWTTVAVLSFLVGCGSYAPSGIALPMLYGNRILEWLGVGMHLPFHISTVGVLALVVVALQAPPRHLRWGIGVLGVHTLISLSDVAVWSVPTYPSLTTVEGTVLHLDELENPSHEVLNDIMILQMSHQQPIATFPVFPTNLTKQEGIDKMQADLASGLNVDTLRQAGVQTLIVPNQHQIPEALQDCCSIRQMDRWRVVHIPLER